MGPVEVIGQPDTPVRHIERIYDAAVAPERWPAFLEGLQRELRLASLNLIFRRPSDGDRGVVASVGIEDHQARAYRSHFYKLNPWRPFGPEAEEGRVVLDDRLFPPSEQVRTEFYNDWMRPQHFAHPFTAFLYNAAPGDPLSDLVGFRSQGAGPLRDEDLDPVRLLVPHLQRALAVHDRVQEARARARAAEQALDRLVSGVILVDEGGAPVFTNRTADRILVANDGLALGRDGLSAANRRQTDELRRLLSGAAATGAGKGVEAGGEMRLARPSGRRAYDVVVTPIRSESSPIFDAKATAAIFVADPEARAERPPERLRRLHGLTPKEAEVASRLVEGMNPAEISDALGVTIHTVRGHLKQLFAKTDTHRQAELVRALLAGLGDVSLE